MAPHIRQVSIEPIREELIRILTEGQAPRGCRMLHESGLMAEILPEVQWNDHLERSLLMLRPTVAGDFAMAVLLHDLSVDAIRRIVERMKFSGAEQQHIVSLMENRERFRTVRTMPVRTLKRFFRLYRFEDHLELARICAAASGADLEDYNYALLMHRTWSQEDISPKPLISGEDLMELGFRPGPLFKEILARVEDEQLEGRVRERQQAIEFVSANYMSKK